MSTDRETLVLCQVLASSLLERERVDRALSRGDRYKGLVCNQPWGLACEIEAEKDIGGDNGTWAAVSIREMEMRFRCQ
jgi:hypothetical protein